MCTVEDCKKQYMISNQYTEAFVQIFFKIGVLQNFSNFSGKKLLCRSLFLVTLKV